MNPWVRRSLMAVAILMFLIAAAAGGLIWRGKGLAQRVVSLPETAVILLDCVIGYGANPDPAAALARVIGEARARAASQGRYVAFVASVTGTEADPQVRSDQERKLREAKAKHAALLKSSA